MQRNAQKLVQHQTDVSMLCTTLIIINALQLLDLYARLETQKSSDLRLFRSPMTVLWTVKAPGLVALTSAFEIGNKLRHQTKQELLVQPMIPRLSAIMEMEHARALLILSSLSSPQENSLARKAL